MILRYDRIATALPPPSEPDPAGAAAVQELLGGAPDYAPEEIAEIAARLREQAGLSKEPTGMVADLQASARSSKRKSASRS